jgi:hypothetical protein
MKRRTIALVLVAVLGLAGAACGSDNSTKAENRTGSTLVNNGDQQGSGADGGGSSGDKPGNTPGGNDAGDQPSGGNSGQDKP